MKNSSNINNLIQIPFLMYHKILDELGYEKNKKRLKKNPNIINAKKFEEQIDYLYKNNYKVLSVNDFYNIFLSSTEKEKNDYNKYLVLTFDDGFEINFKTAIPILKKYGYSATIFLIVSRIGQKDYLSWDQLKLLNDQGLDLQSHAMSHIPLEILREDRIRYELENSKNILEVNLNKKIDFISFPQGSYNARIIQMVKESGYIGCCTSEIKNIEINSSGIYEIGRIGINSNYDLFYFSQIISLESTVIRKLKCFGIIKLKIKKLVGMKNILRLYLLLTGNYKDYSRLKKYWFS